MRLDELKWVPAPKPMVDLRMAEFIANGRKWRVFENIAGLYFFFCVTSVREYTQLDIAAAQCVLYHILGNPEGNDA